MGPGHLDAQACLQATSLDNKAGNSPKNKPRRKLILASGPHRSFPLQQSNSCTLRNTSFLSYEHILH
jgi:hypothetical protein